MTNSPTSDSAHSSPSLSWIQALASVISTQTIKAFEDPLDIQATIERGLASARSERIESSNFKPSSLYDPCLVQEATRRKRQIWTGGDAPSLANMLVMEAGTATHDRMQNVILPQTGRLWGSWECLCCHAVVENSFLPSPCQKTIQILGEALTEPVIWTCSAYLARERVKWKYREPKVKQENPSISGRCDGIWVLPSGKWYVLEMKSCAPEVFEDLSRRKRADGKGFELVPYKVLPTPSHIFQGGLYVAMLHQQALEGKLPLDPGNCSGTILMYVNRATYDTRTWTIPFSRLPYDRAIDTINKIEALAASDDPMSGPKKCSDRNSMYAKTCPFRLECFPYKRAKKA